MNICKKCGSITSVRTLFTGDYNHCNTCDSGKPQPTVDTTTEIKISGTQDKLDPFVTLCQVCEGNTKKYYQEHIHNKFATPCHHGGWKRA